MAQSSPARHGLAGGTRSSQKQAECERARSTVCRSSNTRLQDGTEYGSWCRAVIARWRQLQPRLAQLELDGGFSSRRETRPVCAGARAAARHCLCATAGR